MEAAEQAGQAIGSIAGAANMNLAGPCRVKTWDERTPDERMEMMREEVRYLCRQLTDLQKSARKMKFHQHAQDGSLMVPLSNRDDEDGPRGYFYDPLK